MTPSRQREIGRNLAGCRRAAGARGARIAAWLAAAACLAFAAQAPSVQAATRCFATTLTAPSLACESAVSPATGSGTFVMDTVANTLSFDITFSGLTSAETAAHIHGFSGPTACAGILFGLPAGSPKIGVWSFLEAQEANIIAGLTYVNIHTVNFGSGEIRGQIEEVPCPPTPTPTPTLTPSPTPSATPEIDHYVLYKAKATKRTDLANNGKFPGPGYNLLLDDATLPAYEPDDPENYEVKKERSLAVPAMKNDEPGPGDPALHYIRYQIREAKEGAGPFDGNAYPKAVKHRPRLWSLVNQLGTIRVETKKVEAMLVPAAKSLASPPAAPANATHYVCYQARPTKDVTQQTPDAGGGTGKLRKDLQAYFGDQFLDADCALDENGNPSFPGSPVAGKCLLDLKKVKALCNPIEKGDVGGVPPRFTIAPPGSASAPTTTDSLLCYQAKLASKVLSASAAALGNVALNTALKQSKHVKRSPHTTPGNQLPAPLQMDTKGTEMVCVPTLITGVISLL
jgi:hypothetical protein